jgi:hypothetical protein
MRNAGLYRRRPKGHGEVRQVGGGYRQLQGQEIRRIDFWGRAAIASIAVISRQTRRLAHTCSTKIHPDAGVQKTADPSLGKDSFAGVYGTAPHGHANYHFPTPTSFPIVSTGDRQTELHALVSGKGTLVLFFIPSTYFMYPERTLRGGVTGASETPPPESQVRHQPQKTRRGSLRASGADGLG